MREDLFSDPSVVVRNTFGVVKGVNEGSACLPPELDNPEARVKEIHLLVHRLPEKNRQMLELLMNHLAK